MKGIYLSLFIASMLFSTSCLKDDTPPVNEIEVPETYSFTRNGKSTVSFTDQTIRIAMAEELVKALTDKTKTKEQLEAMFSHQAGAQDFESASLNTSDINIESKIAASKDYFSSKKDVSDAIKNDFKGWINSQVTEVFPNWDKDATAGQAGKLQEAGKDSYRYVNAKGMELNQVFAKAMIGALMTDQMLNNYLSVSVLDEGTNVEDNTNSILVEGKNYTAMEHLWDEAYGYLYGAEDKPSTPELNKDSFLNKYLKKVDDNSNFKSIKDVVSYAFKLGRAAIVVKNYKVRNMQAAIIRANISVVIAVRAIHYLQAGKSALNNNNTAAFHDLSEAYGFIYSLQFTRKPGTNVPYFTKSEVDEFLEKLGEGNGFWDLTAATLDKISEDIAKKFGFTVAQAK